MVENWVCVTRRPPRSEGTTTTGGRDALGIRREREKLIKIGAKVIRHAKYVTFQMAEVAVPRRLYRVILERIRRFAKTPIRPAPT